MDYLQVMSSLFFLLLTCGFDISTGLLLPPLHSLSEPRPLNPDVQPVQFEEGESGSAASSTLATMNGLGVAASLAIRGSTPE
jgi:hypothetical protein